MADDSKPNTGASKPVEKSTAPAEKSGLDKAIDLMGTLVKTLEDKTKSDETRFAQIEASLKSLSEKPKAMETPTDLPLEPAQGSSPSDNDIGAKVTAPKDWYQSQSRQASLDQASPTPAKDDKPDLKMEQKSLEIKKENSFTSTQTPRPGGVVNKSAQEGFELNPILKDARAFGYAGIDEVARRIRSGHYHQEPRALPYGGSI